MTDEELMRMLGSQSDADTALKTLQQRHGPVLRCVIAKVVWDHADVDDVMQELWLQVLTKHSTYDPAAGALLGWLITMARRRAIDSGRKKLAHTRAVDRYEISMPVEPMLHLMSGEDEAGDQELAVTVQEAMDCLPEVQREVIDLYFFKGLSQRDIAEHTATPLGTVKTRIDGALNKLRRSLIPASLGVPTPAGLTEGA